MSTKQCLKCHHQAAYEGAPPLACPECGAVYSKVEAAFRDQPPPLIRPVQRTRQAVHDDHHDYADQLRSESLYPAFRSVIKVIYLFGLTLAVLTLFAGIFLASRTGPAAAVGGLIASALIFVVFKVSKEVSLMMADLSDSAVRLAFQAERDAR